MVEVEGSFVIFVGAFLVEAFLMGTFFGGKMSERGKCVIPHLMTHRLKTLRHDYQCATCTSKETMAGKPNNHLKKPQGLQQSHCRSSSRFDPGNYCCLSSIISDKC